jgi:hypothetical protein
MNAQNSRLQPVVAANFHYGDTQLTVDFGIARQFRRRYVIRAIRHTRADVIGNQDGR